MGPSRRKVGWASGSIRTTLTRGRESTRSPACRLFSSQSWAAAGKTQTHASPPAQQRPPARPLTCPRAAGGTPRAREPAGRARGPAHRSLVLPAALGGRSCNRPVSQTRKGGRSPAPTAGSHSVPASQAHRCGQLRKPQPHLTRVKTDPPREPLSTHTQRSLLEGLVLLAGCPPWGPRGNRAGCPPDSAANFPPDALHTPLTPRRTVSASNMLQPGDKWPHISHLYLKSFIHSHMSEDDFLVPPASQVEVRVCAGPHEPDVRPLCDGTP